MPTRKLLSKRVVEAIHPPGKGAIYVYDEKVRSLAVCVTSAGSRTFYRTGRVNGKPQRIKLGRFGEITVDEARAMAAETSLAVVAGESPLAKINESRMTLGELWTWYFANHAKPRKRTWEKDESRWNRYLSVWKNRRIGGITKADVVAFHAGLKPEAGPYGANHCLEQLRHMLELAREHSWIPSNPAYRVKRFPRRERSRFLSADEVSRFFTAVDSLMHQTARDFFRVLLFVGARRGNVAAMRWDEIDLETGTWIVPDEKAKGKREMRLVLVPQAVEILKQRKNESEWVFPSRSKTGHYTWPQDAWEKVLRTAGLTDVRMHDLRRTLASWQLATGASLTVIGQSLGHQNITSTAIYARTQLDQVRASVATAVDAMQATTKKEG